MKVCMFSLADENQPYGSTIRPVHLARHLVRLGVELLHICEQHPIDDECQQFLSLHDFPHKPKDELFQIVLDKCKAFSPDIIYSHQIFFGTRFGRSISRHLKKPHVFDTHSSMALEMPTYNHLTFKGKAWLIFNEMVLLHSAHKIITPSPELKNHFVKVYRVSPKKIKIVKNGVETVHFRPAPPDKRLREALGIPLGVPVIVSTIPRLEFFPSNEMALRSLFAMIPEIEKKVPEIRFLILGGGPEPEGPYKNLTYTGFVDDLIAHLNLADVCVAPFPPKAVCGGTRNKISEYLACGKPIVATREAMRGFDDAVPGKHYLLGVEGAEFVENLVDCINNRTMAEQLGKNARVLSQRYDWGYLANQMYDLFQEMVPPTKKTVLPSSGGFSG